jgi:hypothetical protein
MESIIIKVIPLPEPLKEKLRFSGKATKTWSYLPIRFDVNKYLMSKISEN